MSMSVGGPVGEERRPNSNLVSARMRSAVAAWAAALLKMARAVEMMDEARWGGWEGRREATANESACDEKGKGERTLIRVDVLVFVADIGFCRRCKDGFGQLGGLWQASRKLDAVYRAALLVLGVR